MPEKVTFYKVGFAEVFHFAEKNYNIEWNPCNDIFFRTEFFVYKSVNDFEVEDLRCELTDEVKFEVKSAKDIHPYIFEAFDNYYKAMTILLAFCDEHGIDESFQVNSR